MDETAAILEQARIVLARGEGDTTPPVLRAVVLEPDVAQQVLHGNATSIVKARSFATDSPFWLADGSDVLGTVSLGAPEPITQEMFVQKRTEHGLDEEDWTRLWPGVDVLFAYTIKNVTPLEAPRPYQTVANDGPVAADVVDKAVWSTAFVNALPDSAFLYIAPGGKKDGDGKTTPRSLRYFPVKDKSGKVDLPHVRNALARIPQAKIPTPAKSKAMAAARRMLGRNAAAKLMAGLSANATQNMLREVLKDKYPAPKDDPHDTPYVTDLFDDWCVFEQDGMMWRVSYGFVNGELKLTSEKQQVIRNYVYVDKGTKVDVSKPFGGFKNFSACVAAMTKKGHDAKAAAKICGAMQRDTKKGDDEGEPTMKAERLYPVVLHKAEDRPEEERYVLGVVLEPEVVDAQKEIYNEEEVRKAAFTWMESHQAFDLMHDETVATAGLNVDNRIRILENYIAPVDFEVAGQKVKKGSWLIGARIVDDGLWAQVKSKALNGWSIWGFAFSEPEPEGAAA